MAQDDLFELIHSLTAAEKRHFKIHAEKFSSGYKKQYDKLFDALHNWSDGEYDEREFRKKHRGKSFIANLPKEKSHLRELVMKVIRNLSAEDDPEAALAEMLQNIRLLIMKGLKGQAYKMAEKAMALAQESEQYNMLLVIYDQLLKLYRLDPAEARYNARQIQDMDKEALDKVVLVRQALYLREQMLEIQTGNLWAARQREAAKTMERATTLAQNFDLPKRAELSLLNVRQVYLMYHNDWEECLKITGAWLDKIEQAAKAFEYSASQYRVTLANYMLCALRAEKLHLIPPAIAKIKAMKTTNAREAAECFRLGAQYELLYLMNNKDEGREGEIVKHIEEGMQQYKAFLPVIHIVHFRSNLAQLFFMRHSYLHSLQHLNELNQLCGRDERYSQLIAMARAVEWMCHYSLGNYMILDSLLRNMKIYFSSRNMKNEFLNKFFAQCANMIKNGPGNKEQIAALRKILLDTKEAAEWGQLKEIILLWLA